MSDWMRLVSEMKRRSTEEYLTPTQRQVRDKICDLLHYPSRINLFGPNGSGKTYVAWALVRAIGAMHVTLPEKLSQVEPRQDIMLIDNAPYHEAEVRRLLASANLVGAGSVVLITRTPVTMPMHRINLPLPNPAETEAVIKTYWRLGFFQRTKLPDNPNFWNIQLACV